METVLEWHCGLTTEVIVPSQSEAALFCPFLTPPPSQNREGGVKLRLNGRHLQSLAPTDTAAHTHLEDPLVSWTHFNLVSLLQLIEHFTHRHPLIPTHTPRIIPCLIKVPVLASICRWASGGLSHRASTADFLGQWFSNCGEQPPGGCSEVLGGLERQGRTRRPISTGYVSAALCLPRLLKWKWNLCIILQQVCCAVYLLRPNSGSLEPNISGGYWSTLQQFSWILHRADRKSNNAEIKI